MPAHRQGQHAARRWVARAAAFHLTLLGIEALFSLATVSSKLCLCLPEGALSEREKEWAGVENAERNCEAVRLIISTGSVSASSCASPQSRRQEY